MGLCGFVDILLHTGGARCVFLFFARNFSFLSSINGLRIYLDWCWYICYFLSCPMQLRSVTPYQRWYDVCVCLLAFTDYKPCGYSYLHREKNKELLLALFNSQDWIFYIETLRVKLKIRNTLHLQVYWLEFLSLYISFF